MAKYHINPITGDPKPCKATKRVCKYGDNDAHYENKNDARKAYEERMATAEGWLANKKLAVDTVAKGNLAWRNYNSFEVQTLPDGHILAVEKLHSWHKDLEKANLWLTDPSGVTVGFANFNLYDREEHPLVLCDIEVNPEYRGKNYSLRVLKEAEQYYGQKCYTTGSYTPEGFKALSKHMADQTLPYFHTGRTEPEIAFNSMDFVEDWDYLIPKH